MSDAQVNYTSVPNNGLTVERIKEMALKMNTTPMPRPYMDMLDRLDHAEANTPGAKRFDDGKARFDLISPHFMEDLAKVLTMGANKYGANNWKQSIGEAEHDEFMTRTMGSLLRHLNAYQQGIRDDDESGLPHLAHIACNVMFLLEYDSHDV